MQASVRLARLTRRLQPSARRLLPLILLGGLASWSGCNVPLQTGPELGPGPAAPERDYGKRLMVHYMPWYVTPAVRGLWGSHWKGPKAQHHPDQLGTNGLPDLWSHYHPLIGPYDSADPDALECQLLQMRLAGIDGVIADWYGIGDKADHPQIHHATLVLFDAAARYGLQFAACYEDRSLQLLVDWQQLAPDQVTNRLTETLQWMQQTWFTQPHYARLDGRPLLLNFGPVFLQQPEAWQEAFATLPEKPAFFGLHHLWRKVGAEGGFTWVHTDPWEGTPDDRQIRTRIGEVFTYFSTNPAEVIVSAYPGYNDVDEEGHRELPHRDGQTLRETLAVALAGPWPIIQLVTWNDYGEGTIIEPTHEFGYTFLEIIQETRRKELGDAFAFTADDLRLPAWLYALRKTPGRPAAALDRISALLKDGHTEAAAAALREAESTLPQPRPL